MTISHLAGQTCRVAWKVPLIYCELATRCGIGGSTLTHHLRALAQAGLVAQEKRGRSIVCTATFDQVQVLSDFLLSECCQDCHGCRHTEHHGASVTGH